MEPEKISEIKKIILPILKRYNVKRAGIFGSVVRGEETENSDIDLLVEIEDEISLLDFAGLKLELEESLGRKVDLGEYAAIKPVIKEQILSEEVSIL
jgi:predicted nucleotidyltransferase